MRKLISCLLIAMLAFPGGAFAQSSGSNVSPTSVNHPAFATLLQQVQKTDSAGIDVPVNDPNAGTTTMQHVSFHDLSDAQGFQSNGTLAAGCNPVVWANMVQQARKQVIREVTGSIGAHGQLAKAMSNKCTSNVGALGEDRTSVQGTVWNYQNLQATAENLACSLNFSKYLSGLFGGSLSFCKGGSFLSGGVNSSIQNSFLVNGTDPTKSAHCLQPNQANANLMTQTAGSYGTSLLNGSDASKIQFSSGGINTGGGGLLSNLTIGGSIGGSSNNGGNGISTTTTVGNTTSTSSIGTGAPSGVPSSGAVVTPTNNNTTGTSSNGQPASTLNIFK